MLNVWYSDACACGWLCEVNISGRAHPHTQAAAVSLATPYV